MSGVFNGVFWLVVLVFLSFWVASLAFFPFLIVSVLLPCIPGLQSVYDLLLACVLFPSKCSDNMVNRRSYNSI